MCLQRGNTEIAESILTKFKDFMSSELRRRSVSSNVTDRGGVGGVDPITMTNYEESHLSAHALIAASPIHSSPVMKMHVPPIYEFLPSTIQWLLARCCKGMAPQWKRRYLIALGEYLYRFKNEDGASPKGSPIPVATAEARIISSESDNEDYSFVFDLLPEDCHAVFEVSSIGKTQYFAVASKEEATIWVTSIRQMKQDAITRNMGHSRDIPYPKEWRAFDESARRLKDQKIRIKSKLEAMNRKEQEMTSLGAGAGGINMGYYS